VNHDSGARSGNASSKRQDDKTSRSWRNTSPDGQWRETETPRAAEKPGDVKIMKNEKKDRGRDEGQHGSTSSAWRPKSSSPDATMWRPASASTQASSMEDDGEELHANFRKYLNGYRNKSPDSVNASIIDDDDAEDLSFAQRQWLQDRSKGK
jgi:hypothetical protein